MIRSSLRGSRRALVMLVGALLGAAALGAKPGNGNGNGNGHANGRNPSGTVLFSGQATALKIDGVVNPTPGQIVVCDTGPLPASGGHLQVSQSNYSYAGGALRIEHASATTSGSGREAFSTSTLSGYHVEFETETSDGHRHRAVIEADLVYGAVSAVVDRQGRVSVSSQVIIEGLRVNGQPIVVTGQPNQRVDLPHEVGGYFILNEQANAAGANGADIAVSPIHFFVCHCIEGHVGLVRAGISASGTPPPDEGDCGKVTGGGWIVATGGEKGTFGMSGGIRRGEFWGHLNYIDHGAGLRVKSTAVTNFQFDPTQADGRIITYNVTINGAPGTARLRVVDRGEPGRRDIFDLTLSTGYRAAGELGGARPGGGNIQNHKCPPGWE